MTCRWDNELKMFVVGKFCILHVLLVQVLVGLSVTPVFYYWAYGKLISRYGHHKDQIVYLDAHGLVFDLWLKMGCGVVMVKCMHNVPNTILERSVLDRQKSIGFINTYVSALTSSYRQRTRITDDAMFPALVAIKERWNGLHPDILKAQFEDGFGVRSAKMALTVIKAIVVGIGLVHNVFLLPERDPEQPLNQAKHYVAYLEVSGLVVLVISLIGSTVLFWCRGRGSVGTELALWTKRIGDWSAFSLLSRISIDRLASRAWRATKYYEVMWSSQGKYLAAVILCFLDFAISSFGIAAMAVKVSQIGFVTTTLYLNYSTSEVFRLATFTLSLTSIVNISAFQMKAVEHFLVQDAETFLAGNVEPTPLFTAWKYLLGDGLSNVFQDEPWKTFVVMGTLSVTDVRNLLVQQNTNPDTPPKLFVDMLTDETREMPESMPKPWRDAILKRRERARRYLEAHQPCIHES